MSETKKIAKHVRYGALLVQKIAEIISEDGGELDIRRIAGEDGLNDFLHALANVMPTAIFRIITNNDVDLLEFNHIANNLCFQYGEMDDAENEKEL